MAELVHALGMMPSPCPDVKRILTSRQESLSLPELAPKNAMTATVAGMRDIVGMEFGDVESLNWTRNERKALSWGPSTCKRNWANQEN